MCKFSYGVIFFGFQKEIRKSVVFVLWSKKPMDKISVFTVLFTEF